MKRLFHFLVIFVILFSGCTGFRKKYVVGIDPSFYPANMGGQANNVYGFMVDLLEEIAKTEGVEITYKQVGSESFLNGLQRKAYDGLITPKENIEIQSDIYSTSKPIFLTGPVLVTPNPSGIHSLSQMNDKIVGVVDNSDSLLVVERYSKVFINTYTSPILVMEAMKFKLVDAALLDTLVAYAYVTNVFAGKFQVVTTPLNDEGIYLVTMKDRNPLLIDVINQGVKRMKARGVYKKLLKKWNLYPEALTNSKKSLKKQ